MARILPNTVNADFITAHGVEGMVDCAPETLTIKVWDLYGTAPKDNNTATAEGQFIAAVVICDTCDKSVELHRDKLGG
jgi:hypothetical protein